MSAALQETRQPVNGQILVSNSQSLLSRMGERYGVDADKMLTTLKQTAFRQRPDKSGEVREVTNEQMMALLIVADQYRLNPWTREIYAFPQDGGIVPIVGVDGWIRMMNEHPHFDGIEFVDGPEVGEKPVVSCEWVEAKIYRKDRQHPVVVREYVVECRRNTIPWNTMPRRMLRHKALIQCCRVAFGFAGIYDEDDATAMVENRTPPQQQTPLPPPTGRMSHKQIPTATQPATQPEQEPQPAVEVDEDTELQRQELISHIDAELNGDITPAALKSVGELIQKNQQLLGPDFLENFQRRWQRKQGAMDTAFASNATPEKKTRRF